MSPILRGGDRCRRLYVAVVRGNSSNNNKTLAVATKGDAIRVYYSQCWTKGTQTG